jgi:hypothetical protein
MDRLKDAGERASHIIRRHPLASVGCAFAAGFLVAGRILGRPLARTVSGGTLSLAGRAALALAKPAAFQLLQNKLFASMSAAQPPAAPVPADTDT